MCAQESERNTVLEKRGQMKKPASFLQIQASFIPRALGFDENILLQRREFPKI